MKKILALLLVLVLSFSLVACGGNGGNDTTSVESTAPSTMGKLPANPPVKPQAVAVGENGSRTDDAVGFQLELPEIGEKIAVFETSKGNIYMRLFPNSAPVTVANFVGLIEAGYYDGLSFHRVIDGFMIQGGDPTATGSGGECVWGGSFDDEFNANLLNIRGSLSMANSGANTNGSQFFINQSSEPISKANFDYNTIYNSYVQQYGEQIKAEYEQYKSQLTEYADADAYMKAVIDLNIGKGMVFSDDVSTEAWELYKTHGGNIHLDGAFKRGYGGHSVFAQVFSGMSVVDEIAKVDVDENAKPLSDVLITKAYTTTVTAEILALADKVDENTSSDVVVP